MSVTVTAALELVERVGNPADAAVLLLLLYILRDQIRPPRFETLSAAVVALAQREDGVDDTTLQKELDVPQREVDDLKSAVCKTEEEG